MLRMGDPHIIHFTDPPRRSALPRISSASELELGGRWLLGADSDSESEDDCEEFLADTF